MAENENSETVVEGVKKSTSKKTPAKKVVAEAAPQTPVLPPLPFFPSGTTADRLALLLKRRGFMRDEKIMPAVYEYLESRFYSLDYTGEPDEEFSKALCKEIGWDNFEDLYVRDKSDDVWQALIGKLERK